MNLIAWFQSWQAERLERKFFASLPTDVIVTLHLESGTFEQWNDSDLFDKPFKRPDPTYMKDVIGAIPLTKKERRKAARHAYDVYGPVENHLGEDSLAMRIIREEDSGSMRLNEKHRNRKLVVQGFSEYPDNKG